MNPTAPQPQESKYPTLNPNLPKSLHPLGERNIYFFDCGPLPGLVPVYRPTTEPSFPWVDKTKDQFPLRLLWKENVRLTLSESRLYKDRRES